ncbi:MAG: hypothetical protein Q8R35_02645 [bacterium]|nr:hypothetical protein [bacterium]
MHRELPPSHPSARIGENTSQWMAFAFAAAVAYQVLHWIEHLAQFYQHWWLGISLLQAHGIIFFFDLEWNHFTFNTLYWIGLIVVFFGAGLHRAASPARGRPLVFWGFILGGIALQSYHEVEHFAKIYQHLTVGCEPCPGILGYYLDGVYLHFALNTLVLIFPLAAFLQYGFLSRLAALAIART